MSQVIEGVFVDADGNERRLAVAVDADGKVQVVGSLEVDMSGVEIPPPVGGATEAKQDDEIALLGARLPAALTATGNLKVSIEEGGGGDGLTDTQLRATAVPVSGPLTDTELRAAPVPTKTSGASATATISRVSGSATSVTLLAANSNRRRVVVYNESTADLYVKFGATASATSYTTKLGAGDTYESPTDWIYTGVIDGIWSVATGAAQITEL